MESRHDGEDAGSTDEQRGDIMFWRQYQEQECHRRKGRNRGNEGGIPQHHDRQHLIDEKRRTMLSEQPPVTSGSC